MNIEGSDVDTPRDIGSLQSPSIDGDLRRLSESNPDSPFGGGTMAALPFTNTAGSDATTPISGGGLSTLDNTPTPSPAASPIAASPTDVKLLDNKPNPSDNKPNPGDNKPNTSSHQANNSNEVFS